MVEEVAKVEAEIKSATAEVVAEAKKLEEEAKTEVKKVEGEVVAEEKKVEGEVVAEEKKVEGEVVAKAEEVMKDISAEEKLLLTKMENEFLKGQMELQRIQANVKRISEIYPKKVEELAVKYAIDLKTWAFDGMELVFRKK